jgi:O-acetyl-ADP-ribose deacetylase (regulator of RNase III)
MKIEIINTDITTLQIDAIVNAANNSLTGGGGVDGAIHRAAGRQLREYCIGLRGCETGHAKITPGFNLPAKFVIHAVGPVWNNGTDDEENLLAMCYENSLQLAVENKIKTIAFPCISTGAYRFPFDKAATIAIKTVDHFLNKKPAIEKVFFVVFGEKDLSIYKRLFNHYQQ